MPARGPWIRAVAVGLIVAFATIVGALSASARADDGLAATARRTDREIALAGIALILGGAFLFLGQPLRRAARAREATFEEEPPVLVGSGGDDGVAVDERPEEEVADESVADEPVAETAAEEPPADEPTVEAPTVEEPTAEEAPPPPLEKPAPWRPTAEPTEPERDPETAGDS